MRYRACGGRHSQRVAFRRVLAEEAIVGTAAGQTNGGSEHCAEQKQATEGAARIFVPAAQFSDKRQEQNAPDEGWNAAVRRLLFI